MEFFFLLFALVLDLLHLMLQLFVGLLLGLSLCLLQNGLLHYHSHHILVVEVLLTELKRPK